MQKLLNNPRTKGRRRNLRNNATPAERRLWSYLKNSQLGFKFRRQASLGTFIADFYCASRRIVIEVDGASHFETGAAEYDEKRTKFIEALGVRVMRFTNDEVAFDLERVLDEIRGGCEGSNHPLAPSLGKEGVHD